MCLFIRPVELLEVLKDPAILPAVMARYPKTALAESIRSYVATARQALGPCNIQVGMHQRSARRALTHGQNHPSCLNPACDVVTTQS